MAFNTFASATSSIPLANLDANFTAIGTSAAASTLYPTATTSITYGTTTTSHIFNTTGNNGFGVASPTAALHLRAGTATSSPLKLTSGTNLTTAAAGAIEYNGTTLFATGTATTGRGLVLSPSMVRINTTRTKTTNNTTLEPIFDTGNDTLSLIANALYYFKGIYLFTTSATGSAAGIQVGFTFSNTQQDISYRSSGYLFTAGTTATTAYTTVATATTVTGTGTTATSYAVEIEGWFKSNATTGGTITPAFTQSVVGTTVAPSALANSWFMIQPMVANTTATILAGNWA